MFEEALEAIIQIREKLTRDRAVVSKLAEVFCEELSQLSIQDLRRVQNLSFDDADEERIIKDVIKAFIKGTEDDILFQRKVLMVRLRERRLRVRASVRVKQEIIKPETREEAVLVESASHMIARIEVAAVDKTNLNSFGNLTSGSEKQAEESLSIVGNPSEPLEADSHVSEEGASTRIRADETPVRKSRRLLSKSAI